MFRSWAISGWLLALAGWLLLGVLPACAENVIVKNKSPNPVGVQGTAIVSGMLVRGRPYLVQPNDSSPGINLPGNKVLTIFDSRNANRILIQVPVLAGTDDVIFELSADPNSATGVRLDRVPKR